MTLPGPEPTQQPQGYVHLVVGTLICAATMLLFLAFRDSLPDRVPLQLRWDGTTGNAIPRDMFVFGLPLVFALVNLYFAKNLVAGTQTNSKALGVLKFYVVPIIVLALSAATLAWTLR